MSKAGGVIKALGAQAGQGGAAIQAALVETDGVTIATFGDTAHATFAAEVGEDLAERVETACARAMSGLPGARIAGFDGPVLHHDPGAGQLIQAGDGSILAEVLGLPVVWDMRTSDMALGGQGAPLEAFFHHACARWAGLTGPAAFLGLGDRAVLTYVDPRLARAEDAGACIGFDAGPGPCLQDARGDTGMADASLVAVLLRQAYFFRMPPKWAQPGVFIGFRQGLGRLSPADAAATARAALAACVARGFEYFPHPVAQLFVYGQGRHAPMVLSDLVSAVPCPVACVEALGLNGDALGAQAIAWLAVRIARGLPTTGPQTTGVAAAVSGGRISRPMAGSE